MLINWEDVNLCDGAERGGELRVHGAPGASSSSKYSIPFWSLRVYAYDIYSIQENRPSLIY